MKWNNKLSIRVNYLLHVIFAVQFLPFFQNKQQSEGLPFLEAPVPSVSRH